MKYRRNVATYYRRRSASKLKRGGVDNDAAISRSVNKHHNIVAYVNSMTLPAVVGQAG